MQISEFAQKTLAKGYTIADIQRFLKERGFPSSDTSIRAAARSKNRTVRQKKLYAAMTEILDSLPTKPGTEDNFSRKARERDLTVSSVWEYYKYYPTQKIRSGGLLEGRSHALVPV